MSREYLHAALQRLLTESDAVAEQGIEVVPRGEGLALRGQVETPARRAEIERRVREAAGATPVHNEITVTGHDAPEGHEEVS